MLILQRCYYSHNYTRGILNIPNTPYRLDVLELPYKENQQNISCIPQNKYILKCHNSPKFGKCLKVFENINGKLQEVNNRSDILIHAGNAVADFSFYNSSHGLTVYKCDSKGCILVGFGFFEVNDVKNERQAYITGSKKALTFLFDYVESQGGSVDLSITTKNEESDNE